jgi:hypothetical protein
LTSRLTLLYLPIQWFGVLNHFWINYSDHGYKEDLISSHLAQICFDKKSNISTIHDVLMSASQIFHKTHHTQLYKKRGYRHLHGAVREYMINLKERPQVSMSHLDQLLMTLCSFYELVPDSTITNTTSYENLDVTAHPLFQIVNWTSPFTIVCYK